ncbi:MAG: hemolysin family protein [Bacteroidota bacterium]
MEPEPDLLIYLFSNLPIYLLSVPSLELGSAFFLVILLLLCSALISSSEVAFFSITHNDLARLEIEQTSASRRIILLKSRPRKLLATILISNNFINIAIVILSDFVIRKALPENTFTNWAEGIINNFGLNRFDGSWLGFLSSVEGWAKCFSLFITVVAVTFLLVLFGEVAPKIYAKLNNIRLAKMMSAPLNFLGRLFTPFSMLLVNGTNAVERRLASRASDIASREEIDEAIELTVSPDIHSKEEIGILKGIVKFGDVIVKQIMRSRVDVIAVDFKTNFTELLQVIRSSGFSRIPVYDDDFDHITGILYIKDLLGHLDKDESFEWQELIRTDVLYVPESKKINDLLKEFQQRRMHIGIVVDEFGGSAGIVTLEDIMEEVIGEIKDESDEGDEVEYTKIDDSNFIFEGKTLLNDVCRIIEVDTGTFDEVKGDADTVAGLMLEILGIIPKPEVELNYEDYKFRIIAVNKRRIERIQITLPKEQS